VPAGIAITPDGSTAYVTFAERAVVTPIDLTTRPPTALDAIAVRQVTVAAALSVSEPGQAAAAQVTSPSLRWGFLLPRVEDLTGRECEVFALLGEGFDNRMISQLLSLSERTVKFHVTAILRKLGVQSRLQAGLGAAEWLMGQSRPKVQ